HEVLAGLDLDRGPAERDGPSRVRVLVVADGLGVGVAERAVRPPAPAANGAAVEQRARDVVADRQPVDLALRAGVGAAVVVDLVTVVAGLAGVDDPVAAG